MRLFSHSYIVMLQNGTRKCCNLPICLRKEERMVVLYCGIVWRKLDLSGESRFAAAAGVQGQFLEGRRNRIFAREDHFRSPTSLFKEAELSITAISHETETESSKSAANSGTILAIICCVNTTICRIPRNLEPT